MWPGQKPSAKRTTERASIARWGTAGRALRAAGDLVSNRTERSSRRSPKAAQETAALLAELRARVAELERRLGERAPSPAVAAWDLGLLSQRVDRLGRIAELGLELALPSAEETAGVGRSWLHRAEPAPGGPRKVLLTAASGPHVELLSIALSPLHAYARRHSWSLRVVVGEVPADRPAAWAKVPLIREALQEADVVCWLDSDAIVVDLSTDILDEAEPGKDLYLVRHFGADPPHETPNTGVMMWRAGEWADRMLERVWSSEHLVDHPWWENAALLEILGYELEPVARLRERREEMDRVKLIDPAWNSVPYGNPPAGRPRINHWGGAIAFEERRDGMLADLVALRGALRGGRLGVGEGHPWPRRREDLPLLLNARRLIGHGAEIGVRKGDFSALLLERWHGFHLVSVDSWQHQAEGMPADVSNVDQAVQEHYFQLATARLAQYGARSEILRMTSEDAARRIEDGMLDFAYIDARHDEQSVTGDLSRWFAKVRPGGILAGHDYLDGDLPEGHFRVKTSVDRFFGARGIEVNATVDDAPWRSWWVEVPAGSAW